MLSQKTFDGLKSIGLNLYERKLYGALVSRGTSTVGELSELAGVPRSRAYDVLESLAEKGFVVIQHAKPIKFVAVPPKEAMGKAKERLKNNLGTGLKRIDEFSRSASLTELESLYAKGVDVLQSADMSGSFKGHYSVNLHLGSMFKKASSSIDILTTEAGLNELWDNHSSLLQKAKAAGVSIRVAAPITAENRPSAKALARLAEVKDAASAEKELPVGRMVIVDGKETVFGLTSDAETHTSQHISFWTASEHFGQNFAKNTFDMVWAHL